MAKWKIMDERDEINHNRERKEWKYMNLIKARPYAPPIIRKENCRLISIQKYGGTGILFLETELIIIWTYY